MMTAIYVHDTRSIPYSIAIASSIKPIETRTRDVFGRFVGQRVLIIRTRDGHPADIVGSAFIARKKFYSAAELEGLRNQTLIPPGSMYDCKQRGKWGYTMTNAVLFSEPVPLSDFQIASKTRSYATIAA